MSEKRPRGLVPPKNDNVRRSELYRSSRERATHEAFPEPLSERVSSAISRASNLGSPPGTLYPSDDPRNVPNYNLVSDEDAPPRRAAAARPDNGFKASVVMSSAAWTGRLSLREQVHIISEYAPMALEGAQQLADMVEAKRFNDAEALDALLAIKSLHHALGELIRAAEGGQPLGKFWKAVESQKERFFFSIIEGGKIMGAAPVMAFGMAQVLGLLSGQPITGQMLATLAGGSAVAGALAGRKK